MAVQIGRHSTNEFERKRAPTTANEGKSNRNQRASVMRGHHSPSDGGATHAPDTKIRSTGGSANRAALRITGWGVSKPNRIPNGTAAISAPVKLMRPIVATPPNEGNTANVT